MEQKPLAERPGWLIPSWVCLTLESGVPVYLDAERIVYVCGSGLVIDGYDAGINVRESSQQIMQAISKATMNLPPRGCRA